MKVFVFEEQNISQIYIFFSRTESLTIEQEEELEENDGYIFNSRRGTAHMFSCQALDNFLKDHNLSHVVRAHEVQQAGFQVSEGDSVC